MRGLPEYSKLVRLAKWQIGESEKQVSRLSGRLPSARMLAVGQVFNALPCC